MNKEISSYSKKMRLDTAKKANQDAFFVHSFSCLRAAAFRLWKTVTLSF